MPRSAAGVAAPSRAACARVASSARVGPLAGRTRTHAGVAVPRARVEVSRNFSRMRMGEGRLGAANRRLGAHSRRAQYGGSPVENALRRDEVLRRAPVSKSRQSRGRPMRWNSKLAKNSSKKATSRLIEHPLPTPCTPSEPPPPSPPSSLPPRGPPSQPSSVRARPQPPRGSSVVASFNVSFTGNQELSRGVRQTKTESPSGSISTTTPLSLRGGSRPRRAGARPSSRASTRRSRNPASRPRSRGRSGRGGRPCPRGTRRP